MADKKITQLNPLLEPGVESNDVAAVANVSADQTEDHRRDFVQAGIRLMDTGTIDGDKIEDEGITNDKIAPGAVTGGPGGSIATDTITATNIAPNAIGASSELANSSVDVNALQNNSVQGVKMSPTAWNRGLDREDGSFQVGITNEITPGSFAGITYTAQGLISAVDASGDVPRESLPIATDTELGAVFVPTTSGLVVLPTGELDIATTVTAATHTKITYDEHGLVTAGEDLDPLDLPIATTTTVGAVSVPATDADGATPLDIDGAGQIEHAESGVTPDTYPKVIVDKYGHVTGGTDLAASDIPEISAELITSGTFPTTSGTPEQGFLNEVYTPAIADQSISRRHFSDISIAYIQENLPTSSAANGTDATVFRGCIWLRPSTGQLYMFDGNSWQIVAGGQLAKENLRFCGTYNATSNKIVALTDEGVSELLADGSAAFNVGSSLPSCEDGLSGTYFLIDTGGSGLTVTDVIGTSFAAGDIVLGISQASGWAKVAGIGGGGGGGGGSGFWSRTGAAPNALLTPTQAADNLNLQGGDFLALPHSTTTSTPVGGEGSLRWNSPANTLEVYSGSAWEVTLTNNSVIDCGTY